jgi:hypothetical protein
MDQTILIVAASTIGTLVGFVLLDKLLGWLDQWFMQRRIPLALRRRPPQVKRLTPDMIEIIEFGSAQWDQMPLLFLGGLFLVVVVTILPWITTAPPDDAAATAVIIAVILAIPLLVTLWLRNRWKYFWLNLTSGQLELQLSQFGFAGKQYRYLLKLPVQALSPCSDIRYGKKNATLKYSSCWLLTDGKRIRIIHKNGPEAEAFRAALSAHRCPVVAETEAAETTAT